MELTKDQIDHGVKDDGPWRGPGLREWVAQIVRGSTPVREYAEDGSFHGWVNPHLRMNEKRP